MDTQGTLETVLTEIGPQSTDIAAVFRDGDEGWCVEFDNGAIVHLARRSDPARVELIVATGTAPKGTREDVLRCLLMFNFLSADSGGARLGLSAVDNLVHLIRDLPEAELTAPGLHAELRALADVAGKWREFIEEAAEGSDLPTLPTEALGAQA